jgi:hypothetical protein
MSIIQDAHWASRSTASLADYSYSPDLLRPCTEPASRSSPTICDSARPATIANTVTLYPQGSNRKRCTEAVGKLASWSLLELAFYLRARVALPFTLTSLGQVGNNRLAKTHNDGPRSFGRLVVRARKFFCEF